MAVAVVGGVLAVVVVLAAGRWLLRPLFHEIAHSRLRELFTLTVLLVVLGSGWVSRFAGLSLALGAFLSGMMLAETEYRHQIEAVIRPFRDILLGIFFISVGMLLDVRLLVAHVGLVSAMLLGVVLIKMAVAALVTRPFTNSRFKALRTGIVISIGGEFGVALCTIGLQAGIDSAGLGAAVARGRRVVDAAQPGDPQQQQAGGPLVTAREAALRIRRASVRMPLRARSPLASMWSCAASGVWGRMWRACWSRQGFEYIALDLDPARIRAARQAGDPVLFGDSSDEEMLATAGLANASAVVISFSDPVDIGGHSAQHPPPAARGPGSGAHPG